MAGGNDTNQTAGGGGGGGGGGSSWDQNYPYDVDYNDHFETPLVAYEDIAPLLDWLVSSSAAAEEAEEGISSRKDHVIYDPYYCNGQTSKLFRQLGFEGIINRKRDFYKDYEANRIPFHHTLVTNPPYSEHHKIRCLDIAFSQLRQDTTNNKQMRSIPFFCLMPNYVAAREYFRSRAAAASTNNNSHPKQRQLGNDVCYLIPSKPYEYCHPEGTGKIIPPFSSIWFCGIGEKRMTRVKEFWDNLHWTHEDRTKPKLVTSLEELKAMNAIPTEKRGNPRQRKKRRQHAAAATATATQQQQQQQQQQTSSGIPPKNQKKQCRVDNNAPSMSRPENSISHNHKGGKNKRSKSKYRDGTGTRKRKRF